jgi:RND family efflux transporter MFP subunit
MKKTLLPLATGFALAAAALLPGCGKKIPEAVPEQKLPTATVRVQTVESLKRVATEEVIGTVRPKRSASISANVSGAIEQMLVAPGQSVKAGELLVQIDAREIQARLDQAQAVRDQAQKDTERFKTLIQQNAVTQQEFEAVQSRFRIAEATVAEARTMLGYSKIVAPFDALVTAKRADVGDLAAPGKPLLELEDPTALRLEADVPEALLGKIELNDKLAVRVPSANLSLEAVVTEIAPAADPVSRTFRVKLDLPPAAGLRSGQFGRVAVPVAEISALRAPSGAVVVRGQMEIAFVIVNQRAQLRLVKTGKFLDGEVEIVSGLSPGEQLVVAGAAQLLDGQPVEAKR